MFTINDDLSIYVTRGDVVYFSVTAEENGIPYKFRVDDILRIKITDKKDAESVLFQKTFLVEEETDRVHMHLNGDETRFGDVISKPTDYWYEVELNPYSKPQTIIGYDEDGAKIFRLFPEGDNFEYVEPEDVPVVDEELDLTSERPVQNQAITRAILYYKDRIATEVESALAEVHDEIEEYADRAEEAAEQAKTIAGADLVNILNGTTPVGKAKDADTLDGKHASDFISTSGGTISGSALSQLTINRTGTTGGNAIKFSNDSGTVGYLGTTSTGVPTYWDKSATAQTLLTTATGLPLTGGDVTGSVRIVKADATDVAMRVGNSVHAGHITATAAGNFGLYDITLGKWLMQVTKDGVMTIDGGKTPLHTGNSAKVVVSSTPLTAEGSIRVW